MTPARALRAFLAASPGRRRLALEACVELLRASLLTRRHTETFVAALGRALPADGAGTPGDGVAPASDSAREIGRMVERVAPLLPVRAVCLQQAIAAARMLRRRGVPAVVCLGVDPVALRARGRGGAAASPAGDAAAAESDEAAHAWVVSGSTVVAGGGDKIDRFAVVGRFA